MSEQDIGEKLNKNLTDAHSIEEQALIQLRRAPDLVAGELAADFDTHRGETEEHERLVRERLEARGADPSTLKDLAGKAGGLGMAAFAESQPDTAVKLVAHAYSYEALETAAYELLRAAAERAGDEETAALARRIGEEERQMASRLESRFDQAVEQVVGDLSAADLADKVDAYLSDAHAVEEQAAQMLEAAPALVDDKELEGLFRDHLEETERHKQRVEERLEDRGADSSLLKDAALRLGALNLGAFFKAQPDTNAKLAGFAFAFEHLEVALYSMLRLIAGRSGDEETARVAGEILASEREAADRLGSALEQVLQREYSAEDV